MLQIKKTDNIGIGFRQHLFCCCSKKSNDGFKRQKTTDKFDQNLTDAIEGDQDAIEVISNLNFINFLL